MPAETLTAIRDPLTSPAHLTKPERRPLPEGSIYKGVAYRTMSRRDGGRQPAPTPTRLPPASEVTVQNEPLRSPVTGPRSQSWVGPARSAPRSPGERQRRVLPMYPPPPAGGEERTPLTAPQCWRRRAARAGAGGPSGAPGRQPCPAGGRGVQMRSALLSLCCCCRHRPPPPLSEPGR